jgi:hypothetical protein
MVTNMEPIEIKVTIWISQTGNALIDVSDIRQVKDVVKNPIPEFKLSTTLGCHRWGAKIGKKPSKSCKGCTVTCPAKNKYKGEPMEIKPKQEPPSPSKERAKACHHPNEPLCLQCKHLRCGFCYATDEEWGRCCQQDDDKHEPPYS